jgi:TRAP-type C4-dicarboxylate transport system permease small subunit
MLVRVTSKLMEAMNTVGYILLAVMTVFTFMNVVMRYLFARPLAWSEEVSVFCLVWCVYLSQGLLEMENDQLRMTVLYRFMGRKVRLAINGLRSALTIGLCGYILYGGVQIVQRNYAMKTVTQALEFPLWIPYLAIPLAFGCIILVRLVDPLVRSYFDKL